MNKIEVGQKIQHNGRIFTVLDVIAENLKSLVVRVKSPDGSISFISTTNHKQSSGANRVKFQ